MKLDTSSNKLSIKWSVFLYLSAFAAVVISVLWLVQVVFLDDIYKAVKMNEIEEYAENLTAALETDTIEETIYEIASTSKTCVSVSTVNDNMIPPPMYSYHCFSDCVIHSIGQKELMLLYKSAEANGGTSIQRFMYNAQSRKYVGIEGDLFDKSQLDQYRNRLPESIIYSIATENNDGEDIYILLNSEITPVESTVNAMNKIMIVITIMILLLALFLAILISYRVTRPIVKLTESAKELAKGNYDVEFEEGSYREAAQLSQALNYAEKELSRVDELRRELIANISHDLRTPLTMIGGYSEVIRDIPGENTPENIQVIIDETKRLTSLVNDVLDISQLESGVGSINKEKFCLTETIQILLERFRKLCERDGYNIEFICDRDVTVYADEARISQVIYNLVGNAVTHTGDSKNVIVRQIVSNDRVRIEVEDFGEGIAPENLPLIWERYYKVDKVHRRAAIGTGLGLSIVRTIMEQSDGNYGVSSAVGEGSIFFIDLPIDNEASTEISNEE